MPVRRYSPSYFTAGNKRYAEPLLLAFLAFSPLISARAQTAPLPPVTPDTAVLPLDEVGLYGVGIVPRGKSPLAFPNCWSGGFEDRFGLACTPVGVQKGRAAFLLHPPWRGLTGVSYQTFRFRLPAAKAIRLTGATALREDGVGKSDGVTFRVFVNEEKRLDVSRAVSDWQPFTIDLSTFAGKTVTVRFETDPGPQDNASFDFGLWGDRTLTLSGWAPSASASHPAPPPLDLRRLTAAQNGSVIPPNGFPGSVFCQVAAGQAAFRTRGTDGLLEYRWQPPSAPDDPFLGRLQLQSTPAGASAPVTVPLAGQAALEWTAPAKRVSARLTATGADGATVTETYVVAGQIATLTLTGYRVGKSLVIDIACDRPVIRRLDGGGWGPVARRRQVPVPYYSHPITYLVQENLFANAFLDWTGSDATSLDGVRANYDARTDGTRVPLRERLIFTAAWHLDETLPNLPNPPSPFRKDLADRTVLDIWEGRFDDTTRQLTDLAEWGVARGIALVHVWQRSGYDNALPAHVPANADQGGDPAMQRLVHTGESRGYRMALHENYVDYYPNYDGFAEADIARQSDGSRVPAWYNEGTKIQSFAVKPARILPLARTQSSEVLRRYGSSACYLDVHSAVPPWFHQDFDITQPGAGTFRPVWDAHQALWAYERTLHRGPVFGEGNEHWYWSGYLDGVEAQFGQGWPSGQGTSAPLLVDFDLLKIHALQLNHGMGYYERWWSPEARASRSLLDLLDQYRMQEAVFGHAGFLGGSTWSNVPLAWQEAHLLAPVTTRSALAQPVEIAYQVGARWQDATAAAKAGSDFSRVRIRYDNGLTLWANGGPGPLSVGGVALPRWGWLARGAGLGSAGTTLRQGVVSDYVETADMLFANARASADWSAQDSIRIAPTVVDFTAIAPRSFRAAYHWQVGQTLPVDENCFVHFVRPGGDREGIVFQQDHRLPRPTTTWRPGETVTDGPYDFTVPGDLPAGDYLWTIGLYPPAGGGRLPLQGRRDNENRVLLGTLHVTAQEVSFTPEPPTPLSTEPINTAGKVLDFGPIRTDGSVWIHRDGPDWVLQPLPRDRAFTLELSATRFPMPATVRTIGGGPSRLTPIRSGAWWRLLLHPGVREYRWAAGRR